MRRITIHIVILTTLFFFGCVGIEPDATEIKHETVELSEIACVLGGETRTALDSDGVTPLWSSGDRVRVFASSGTSAEFTLIGNGGSYEGLFAGNLTCNIGDELYAVYPAEATFSNGKVIFCVETQQTQTDESDIASGDVKIGLCQNINATQRRFLFSHLLSVAKFKIDIGDLLYPREKILSVTLDATGADIAGEFSVDVEHPLDGLTAINASHSATVALTSAPSAANNIVWARLFIAPCDLSTLTNVTCTITTDCRRVVYNALPRRSFKAGKSYTFDFDALVPASLRLSWRITDAAEIARVTGVADATETTYPSIVYHPVNTLIASKVAQTDYGCLWDMGNGNVMLAYGDNYTDCLKPDASGRQCSAISVSSDTNLADGLSHSFVMNGSRALQPITIALDGQGADATIPTAGVSIGTRQYINYMSIDEQNVGGDADAWRVNYAQLIYSDNYGSSWSLSNVKWDGTGKFVQVAYLKTSEYIYMFGCPAGRKGYAYVARVTPNNFLQKSAYTYWNGTAWSSYESTAAPITDGQVSEFSVAYNSYYKCYLMLYRSVNQQAIVCRTASSPEGEWSGEQLVIEDSGQAIYGPSIHPWTNSGKEFYFVVSHALPSWNVFLAKATIKVGDAAFNLVTEGDFESYPSSELTEKSWWSFPADAVAERADVHNGSVACRFAAPTSEFKQLYQTIAVKPNTDYRYSLWVKSSFDASGTYMKVNGIDNGVQIVDTQRGANPTWQQLSVNFNSGNNTRVGIAYGFWGYTSATAGDLTLIVDDVLVTPL